MPGNRAGFRRIPRKPPAGTARRGLLSPGKYYRVTAFCRLLQNRILLSGYHGAPLPGFLPDGMHLSVSCCLTLNTLPVPRDSGSALNRHGGCRPGGVNGACVRSNGSVGTHVGGVNRPEAELIFRLPVEWIAAARLSVRAPPFAIMRYDNLCSIRAGADRAA